MSRMIALTGAALALGSVACDPLYPRPAAAPDGVRYERVLLRSEIAAHEVRTAYDAVVQLRPVFLSSTRGADATGAPLGVYVDGMRASVEQLRALPAASVREVRQLRAFEATFKYGAGNGPVLDVRTGAPD